MQRTIKRRGGNNSDKNSVEKNAYHMTGSYRCIYP